MADVLAAVAGFEDERLRSKCQASISLIERFVCLFGSSGGLALSFNGGKDSTVVLHLARAAVESARRKAGEDGRKQGAGGAVGTGSEGAVDGVGVGAGAPAPTPAATRPRPDELASVLTFFFHDDADFEEVRTFTRDCASDYGIRLKTLHTDFRTGLDCLIREDGVRAILLGTRDGDPDARGQETISPSSTGWPAFLRVNPILRWSYADVWAFLRLAHLPYCPLYDRGYASLGAKATTRPVDALRRSDGTFAPAWTLPDARLERAGRGATRAGDSGGAVRRRLSVPPAGDAGDSGSEEGVALATTELAGEGAATAPARGAGAVAPPPAPAPSLELIRPPPPAGAAGASAPVPIAPLVPESGRPGEVGATAVGAESPPRPSPPSPRPPPASPGAPASPPGASATPPCPRPPPRTAALVLASGGVLSGRVQETDGALLARKVVSIGWELARVAIVRADAGAVAREVAAASRANDCVLVVGALRKASLAGIAHALDAGLAEEAAATAGGAPAGREAGAGADGAPLGGEGAWLVPTGPETEVLGRVAGGGGGVPIVRVRNAYALPGHPRLLSEAWALVERDALSRAAASDAARCSDPFHNVVFRLRPGLGAEELARALAGTSRLSGHAVDVASFHLRKQADGAALALSLESREVEALVRARGEMRRRLPQELILSETRDAAGIDARRRGASGRGGGGAGGGARGEAPGRPSSPRDPRSGGDLPGLGSGADARLDGRTGSRVSSLGDRLRASDIVSDLEEASDADSVGFEHGDDGSEGWEGAGTP